jgi:hypothetical protein
MCPFFTSPPLSQPEPWDEEVIIIPPRPSTPPYSREIPISYWQELPLRLFE